MLLGRRAVVLGGLGAAVLASCGSAGEGNVDASVPPVAGSSALVALFAASGGAFQAGVAQRLPFALSDRDGVLLTDVPAQVRFEMTFEGRSVQAPTDVGVRREGIPRPYYPVVVESQEIGIHRMVADVNGEVAEVSILVSPPLRSRLRAGRPLPPVATPTPDRPRQVTPICTRVPACPLHEVTVGEALREERPVAVLVASPGTCAVTYCPPALDLVLEAAEQHPRTRFLHAEVYTDASEASSLGRTTEIVQAYGLDFEPALFLADRRGVLRRRLDHIFDRSELEDAIDGLEAGDSD